MSIEFLDTVGSSDTAMKAGLFYTGNWGIASRGGKRYGDALTNGTTTSSSAGDPLSVHGVIGMTTSGASMNAAPALRALSQPMVCYSSTSPSLTARTADGTAQASPNFFRVVPGDQMRVRAAARMMAVLGYTEVISLYFSDVYTRTMCEAFQYAATSPGQLGSRGVSPPTAGASNSSTTLLPPLKVSSYMLPTAGGSSGTAPDFTTQPVIDETLARIHNLQKGPRVIMLCAWENELAYVLKKARELGMRAAHAGYELDRVVMHDAGFPRWLPWREGLAHLYPAPTPLR